MDLGGGAEAKSKLFQNMDMYFKLKLPTLAATWEQIFCPQTHQRSLGWGQKVIFFFSKSGHVAYQIKVEV